MLFHKRNSPCILLQYNQLQFCELHKLDGLNLQPSDLHLNDYRLSHSPCTTLLMCIQTIHVGMLHRVPQNIHCFKIQRLVPQPVYMFHCLSVRFKCVELLLQPVFLINVFESLQKVEYYKLYFTPTCSTQTILALQPSTLNNYSTVNSTQC